MLIIYFNNTRTHYIHYLSPATAQYMPEVLEALAPHVQPGRHLIVPIAAGVTTATYEAALPKGTLPKSFVIEYGCTICYCSSAKMRGVLAHVFPTCI